MKKTLILVILFSFVISLTTCSDDSDDKKIIPSEKFVLPEGCKWSYIQQFDKVYRVDNADELKKLIVYDGEVEFDFEKKTLLVAYIGTGFFRKMDSKLYVKENKETVYQFDVIVEVGSGEKEDILIISIIALSVDKIDVSTSVDLNIVTKEFEKL